MPLSLTKMIRAVLPVTYNSIQLWLSWSGFARYGIKGGRSLVYPIAESAGGAARISSALQLSLTNEQ